MFVFTLSLLFVVILVCFHAFFVVCCTCCNWLLLKEQKTRKLYFLFARFIGLQRAQGIVTRQTNVIFFWRVLLLNCTEPRKLSEISQENKNYIPPADPFAPNAPIFVKFQINFFKWPTEISGNGENINLMWKSQWSVLHIHISDIEILKLRYWEIVNSYWNIEIQIFHGGLFTAELEWDFGWNINLMWKEEIQTPPTARLFIGFIILVCLTSYWTWKCIQRGSKQIAISNLNISPKKFFHTGTERQSESFWLTSGPCRIRPRPE